LTNDSRRFGLLILVILFFLPSCSLMSDRLVLKQSQFSQIDGWDKDSHASALVAFEKSCEKFNSLPPENKLNGTVGGTYAQWQSVCNKLPAAENIDDIVAKQFFESNFTPYKASNWWKSEGRFTGYFEMGLEGSYTRHDEYQYPIYKKPNDLKEGQKYLTRADIESGALKGKKLEIAWVNDPVRLFFLQIQGSGRIHMDDGSVLRVGYAGKNGYGYVPIGRVLIDRGYFTKEQMSAQAIKKWLYENPGQMDEVMNQNPSYVFFREIGEDGPIGAQGVALTAERSLAVDKRFVPYGAPVFVDVSINGATENNKSFKKLCIAQDTGGAIRGPVRGDVFFGYGDEAEELAGYQNSLGKYFILLPKEGGV
jgi:membrane-bound lytic murein transglycosylase A